MAGAGVTLTMAGIAVGVRQQRHCARFDKVIGLMVSVVVPMRLDPSPFFSPRVVWRCGADNRASLFCILSGTRSVLTLVHSLRHDAPLEPLNRTEPPPQLAQDLFAWAPKKEATPASARPALALRKVAQCVPGASDSTTASA